MNAFDARTVRQNLRVIGAASRAAGLNGFIRVHIDQGSKSRACIPLALEDIEDLNSETLDKLMSKAVSGDSIAEVFSSACVYSSPEDAASGRHIERLQTAVLIYRHLAYIKAEGNGTLEQNKNRSWKKAQPLIEKRKRHGEFLESLGLFARLEDSHWQDDPDGCYRYINFWFAAAVSKPDDDGRIQLAVQTLGGLSDDDCADEDSLTLAVPLFESADPEEIASGGAMNPDELVRLSEEWLRAGRSHRVFSLIGRRGRELHKDKKIEFLVESIIPFGRTTLIAGEGGVGKSTFVHELAVMAARRDSTGLPDLRWMGHRLTDVRQGGVVAYLSGEDDRAALEDRLKTLDPEESAEALLQSPSTRKEFECWLSDLRRVSDLRLLIVDPARVFAEGNEDRSDDADRFFVTLQEFAEETGCAVIVTHHLTKARVGKLSDIRHHIRGSSVYVDRPRVVLGMYRKGRYTFVGVVKTNLLPGSGALRKDHEIRLMRNEETLRHIPAPADSARADQGNAAKAPTAGEKSREHEGRTVNGSPSEEEVAEATKELCGAGKRVARTGRKSLYYHRMPQFRGVSRRQLDRAISEAINAGLVTIQAGYLETVEQ